MRCDRYRKIEPLAIAGHKSLASLMTQLHLADEASDF